MKLINTKIKVANKWAVMLEEIDNEGKDSGIWAYSKKGFRFAEMQSHTAHEYNQKDLLEVIRTLEPCDCEKCREENGSVEDDSETLPEQEKNKCTFCGNEDHSETKNVEGYTVLESCEDCESEIKSDSIPDQIHICNGCDEMYHDEMSTGECCDGETFRIVDKEELGYY